MTKLIKKQILTLATRGHSAEAIAEMVDATLAQVLSVLASWGF